MSILDIKLAMSSLHYKHSNSNQGGMNMKLAVLWLALMLVYLLGDVLRIFSGDFVPGQFGGKTVQPIVWLGAAVVMLIPIVMMLVNVFWDNKNIVYANIIATSILFLFNAVGLPSYKSLYDIFLIVVGLFINVAIGVFSFIK